MANRDEAAEKFERWRECRSLLDQKTRVLQEEMDEFLAGNRPMPADLLGEVLELQKQSTALLKQLVNALNTP